MNKHLLTFIMLVGFLRIAHAEKAPVKYGEISKADLINNVYAPDTSAPAVILCDYGYFTGIRFQFVRILRIKILKKEGYDWANQRFQTSEKTNIHGITYNLENNSIVESKLKNESIFKTRITEDYYEMRVAMPNVKVGSIIDIQFEFNGIPYAWEFQQEIPVVHSELIIEPNTYLKYHKNYFGYIPLNISTDDRWVSENVPAFKPEPYMTSSKNYRTRFEFDLESVSFPGYFYKSFTDTWESVSETLLSNSNFGVALNSDGYINSVAKDIKAQCATSEEMIKMAYNYTKKMKWNKAERVFTDKSFLSSAYKEGKGNSADVNLALVQLLRKLDFKASPIVLSTRDNGRLSEMNPTINKLNYVIAAIFTDKDTLLLDATEENCPYYLLPMRDLNGQGQLMEKYRTGWIQLESNKKDKQMVVYNLSIQDDMSLKGNITYVKGDYAALDFRNNYDGFNSDDEYLTKFKEGKSGMKVISHKIDNLDSLYKAINEVFEIVSINSVNEINGELYIMPLLFEQLKENPFKISERKYPVDYGYTRDKTLLVNYTIPEGYGVISLPATTSLKLPGNSASYTCKSTISEGKISVLYKLNLNNSLFLQSQYADLREFYNQVIALNAEPIVLKKN